MSDAHWLVMQSLKHKKWVLAVMRQNFAEYQVTELMSENVDKIIQYADYLNKGKVTSSLDGKSLAMLERLKEQYESREL